MRWLEDVEDDLRVLKVKRWRLEANSREECTSGVIEAVFVEGRRGKACV
jgi:hypothetical protein